jgi:hypothetical protein
VDDSHKTKDYSIKRDNSIKHLPAWVVLIVLSLFVGCAVRRTLVPGCEAYAYPTYAPAGCYVQPTTLTALAQSDWSTSKVIKNNASVVYQYRSAGTSDSEIRFINRAGVAFNLDYSIKCANGRTVSSSGGASRAHVPANGTSHPYLLHCDTRSNALVEVKIWLYVY